MSVRDFYCGYFYRIGCYILDNFPFTREQFTLMIERGLVPDSFIYLNDESTNGSYLAKRYETLHSQTKAPASIADENNEIPKTKDSKLNDKEQSKIMDHYQTLRTTFDNNCQQLMAIVNGTNNLEPMTISVENDEDNLLEEAIKAVEGIHY